VKNLPLTVTLILEPVLVAVIFAADKLNGINAYKKNMLRIFRMDLINIKYYNPC
jgi:hypothetical protein